MEQDLSRGERSERTSRKSTDQQEERAASNEEAFDRREKLHLGSNFHVIGDLENWQRGWSHDVSSSIPSTDFTRVLCLNVGGGPGTLTDPDKLAFIAYALIQQGVHIACLTESGITVNGADSQLP
jgi:hypothetical protein